MRNRGLGNLQERIQRELAAQGMTTAEATRKIFGGGTTLPRFFDGTGGLFPTSFIRLVEALEVAKTPAKMQLWLKDYLVFTMGPKALQWLKVAGWSSPDGVDGGMAELRDGVDLDFLNRISKLASTGEAAMRRWKLLKALEVAKEPMLFLEAERVLQALAADVQADLTQLTRKGYITFEVLRNAGVVSFGQWKNGKQRAYQITDVGRAWIADVERSQRSSPPPAVAPAPAKAGAGLPRCGARQPAQLRAAVRTGRRQ